MKEICEEAMDQVTTTGVIKLEGAKNWNVWKFQVGVILRSLDLLDIVEGKIVKPEPGQEKGTWLTKDAKAQSLIVTRLSEELKQLGEEISDRLIITKILMSLPEKYSYFVSAWESTSDDKQTVENLSARLLIEEERLKVKSDSVGESVALQARKQVKTIKCFKCGKEGHFIKNCRCFKCGKEGHFIKNCRYNSEKSSSDNRNMKRCYYCNKMGHLKNNCRFRIGKDQAKNSNAFFVTALVANEQINHKWFLDSGASEHMTFERNLYMASAINKGYTMTANHDRCEFIKNKRVCAIAKREENIYIMEFKYNDTDTITRANVTYSLKEWHERLAHQNCKRVKDILKERNIEYTEVDGTCTACLEGKQHRLPFPTSETVTSQSGYGETTKGYRIYYPEQRIVKVKRDVIFIKDRVEVARKEVEQECATEQNTLTGEDMLNCNEEESEDNKRQDERNRDKDLRETEETGRENDIVEEYVNMQNEVNRENLNEERNVVKTRSKREIRKPKWLDDYETGLIVMDEQLTFEEATTNENSEYWQNAIRDELNSLKENN
ncbi:Zinc knuckle [Popillia japonica]|uniref:Zinc knuckle n=1 Tax=Popillia japonica TaxID=7064 RepID=A0AAW1KNX5_POPJA